MLVLPALIGIFWGAPLIARELDAGTHRLVWNQSVTRTRWLAVKLGLIGLAAVAVVGLGSLAVDWWSDPIDKAAVAAHNVSRIEPLLFGARGIAPMGYAAFAFALGVTLGMLLRRTIPAMALTLAIFVGLQVAIAELVRPHLITPTRATVEITPSNVDEFIFLGGPNGPLQVGAQAAEKAAWVLSSHTVDASGRAVETITGEPIVVPDVRTLRTTRGTAGPTGRRPRRGSRTLPGRAHAARLPAAGHLPARQPLLALAVARDRDLHRARPRPLRVLLLVAPPPRLLTTPQPDRPGENPGRVGLVRDADPDRLRFHQTQRLRARRTATRRHSYCRSAAIGSVAAGGSAGVAGDDDAVLVGEDDGLHSVSQAELHQQAADVGLDGRFRHDQSLGDLAVRAVRVPRV